MGLEAVPMKKRSFHMLLVATDISLFGSLLTAFSIPLLVYSWYHSGIFLSIFELAALIPSISLGIYIGISMKNRDARKMWVVSSIALSLVSFSVFLRTDVWFLLMLNILSSSIGVISTISYQSMLADIVEKEDLSWANSTLSLSMSAVALTSPLLGAYLLTMNEGLPFLVDSASFFVAALIVWCIAIDSRIKAPAKKERFSAAFRTSIAVIKKSMTVRNTLILFLITGLIGGGLKIVNVAYFSSFPAYYMVFGAVMASSYAGDISVKSAVSVKLIKITNPYKMVVLSSLFYTASFLILFIRKDFYMAILAFFLLGIGNGILAPNRVSIIQKDTPREHLSSVFGLMSTLGSFSRIVSVSIFGIAVSLLPARFIYGFMGLFMLLVFAVFYPSTGKRE